MRYVVETPIISNFANRAPSRRGQRQLCTTALKPAAPHALHQRLFFIGEELVNIPRRQIRGRSDTGSAKIAVAQIVSYMAQYPLLVQLLQARRRHWLFDR